MCATARATERTAASPLFATRTDRPLNRTNLLHHLQRIGRNAGVESVHPHRFRHIFAIMYLRNGGNVFELQRILGHESLDTMRTYLALGRSGHRARPARPQPRRQLAAVDAGLKARCRGAWGARN